MGAMVAGDDPCGGNQPPNSNPVSCRKEWGSLNRWVPGVGARPEPWSTPGGCRCESCPHSQFAGMVQSDQTGV